LAECVDPDFPESTLLEQFQAQIGSALTPAFAADSSPEIAAEAISICAEFISSDIVKDVDHMGRLLKILVAGLVNIDGKPLKVEAKVNNFRREFHRRTQNPK
jgi:HEAT repeat-containing protein 5